MSYVLEAIVVPALNTRDNAYSGFDAYTLPSGASLLARRGRKMNVTETDSLASELSREVGAALLIRKDTRAGLSRSTLFRQGQIVSQFTEDDELWGLVDCACQLLPGSPLYTLNQLEEDGLLDADAEVVQSAIELGCNQAGLCAWKELREFMKTDRD